MRMFFVFIVISLGIAWVVIALSDSAPNEPSLSLNKRRLKGKKYIYVAFKANQKMPWRRIGRFYKGTAPSKNKCMSML